MSIGSISFYYSASQPYASALGPLILQKPKMDYK